MFGANIVRERYFDMHKLVVVVSCTLDTLPYRCLKRVACNYMLKKHRGLSIQILKLVINNKVDKVNYHP